MNRIAAGMLIVWLGICAGAGAENVLGNGGFETGTPAASDAVNASFDKWVPWKWNGECQVNMDPMIAHGGKSSCVFVSSDKCKIAIHQPIALEAGTYKLSGYIRAINLKPGAWDRGIVVSIEPKGKEFLQNLPLGTYGWRKFEGTFKIPEADPKAEVFVYLFGGGKVWLDDFDLEKVEGDGLKEGMVVGDAEKFAEFDGPNAMKCAYCGMKLDPKKPACVVCGEPTAGLEAYAKVIGDLSVLDELQALVDQAKAKNIDTLYAEIPVFVGKRFIAEGWRKEKDEARRADWTAFLAKQAAHEKALLAGALAGTPDPRAVPPVPDYRKLQKKDNYFYLDGKPVLLVTQGNSGGERGDTRYFAPGKIYGIVSAVGATRYDYDKTPIWELYQKDPKSHRIYDGGWCGHIIRDKWSIGGASAGPCVISLDYPPMREAVKQAVTQKAKEFGKYAATRPERILSMDWEFSYQNYDESSTKLLWQKWLKERYGAVEKLNGVWKTTFASFDDVTLPPIEWNRETNPAKYYDFSEFNLWRFTDYFVWARKVIEGEAPGYQMTTGGGNPFGADFAKQGIDEELLVTMGAEDVFLSETGSRSTGTAIVMDLQHSMAPDVMIHDPEYHATGGFMPLMFFHGASTLDFYYLERDGLNRSMPHAYASLRGPLDVRRLANAIVQFPKATPQVALLYSRGSLIQRHPGRMGSSEGADSPYTLELKKCYRAGDQLDTAVGFKTTRQVKAGIPQDVKVFILPCAYYLNEDEWKGATAFAQKGGTLVVTPTSAVADEYNRRRDYLKDLGVEIVKEIVPKYLAGKAQAGVERVGSEYDFIQGPIAFTEVADSPTAAIRWAAAGNGPAALAGDGIRQEIKVAGAHDVLATFDNGRPAVVQKKLGAGRVIYLAMQLDEPSMRRLLDWVYDQAGVIRPARVTDPEGRPVAGIESRTVATPDGALTYLYNMNETTVKAMVRPAAGLKVGSIEDLTYARALPPGSVIELGPYDYVVLKLKP